MLKEIDANEAYDNKSAARILRQKPSTLTGWRHQRKGPDYSRWGRTIIYTGKNLLDYIAGSEVDAETKQAKVAAKAQRREPAVA